MSWPFNPTHAVLLPSGKVMWWGSFVFGGKPQIWDPVSNTNKATTPPGYNIFCGGHNLLANGQVFITGGDAADSTGVANASIYDPVSGTWTFLPDMNGGRWYPTNTVLANGDVAVTSGELSPSLGNNPLPQVWQASSGTWRDLTTAQFLLPLYPPMFLAPNGTLFYAGTVSEYLNTDGTGSWTIGPSMQFGARGYGPAVMYGNGQIMITGGGATPTATAETIDLNAPVPSWKYTGSMAAARRQANATLLPDGTVLVTGGTSGVPFDDNTNAVYPAELWNPTTGSWSTMASLSLYRGYHSVALLLPDGRVLSAGGECTAAPNCNRNSAEIFSPPYLFKGARPTISSAPSSIGGGQTFFVGTPDAASVTQVSWIRLGAVTHTFNQEQRFNSLGFSQTTGGLNVTAPPSANLAPPGFYMLFLLNSSGVPSVASIIQVDNSSFATNAPAVTVSQNSVVFAAKLQVGTSSTSRSVQLANLGTSPVTINSVTSGADFPVTSTTCGNQLAPGSCTINIAFKPTTGGQLNEFLTINDSDPSSPQTVALSGTGTALKVPVTAVNFGNRSIGTTSPATPITLTNLGSTPISIASISYPNSEFGQYLPTSTCGASIPALSSCQVFSVFTPNAAGPQTGSFIVLDSDPNSPTTINLTGAGLALGFSPPSLAFGSANIQKKSNSLTLTVTNASPVPINFSSIDVGGVNPGDFVIQNDTCAAMLAPGQNCAMALTLIPQASGARSATLTFTDDGYASPQVVTMAGHGVAVLSSIAVTPAQSSLITGNTQQFTATGMYADGSTSNLTTSATWSSSNTSVATISNSSGSQGLATAAAVNSTTITAIVNSIKGSTPLAVQNSTTTTVRSNTNPSTFGQAVPFTATVSPTAATGTIQFLDGVNELGSGTLSRGTANFTASSLTVGAHNITALYKGDAKNASSMSSALSQTVNQVSTSTALSVDVNPATAGQTVNFTAAVSPNAATGSVQFVDSFNGVQTVLGTVPLSSGASVLPTALASGTHSITAVYSGDVNDIASTSAILIEIVN